MELIHNHHVDILFLCEPRISSKKAIDTVKSLGFPCYEIVDSVGFSGGLWLLWKDTNVNIEILGSTDQSITTCVTSPGKTPWLLTTIYASPCGPKREKLWEYLDFVNSCHQLPWVLAGDFNEMLHVEDKLGGALSIRHKGFKKWFDNHAMVDLGFYGPKYTWTNKRVFERLDRAICNLAWKSLFGEAHVKHLPRTKSDHNPIKLCLKSGFTTSPGNRPFRFEAMWLKHEGFTDFITQNWQQLSGPVWVKSYGLVDPLKLWNLQIFGHLKQRKARLLDRINGIQKAQCSGFNRFLQHLESSLVDEFNTLLE
ncbi:uncharacterized protein LOC110767113 [Prunus avium]|uniref:Uncharacterized protein LOC110767113 n=1 Tax=Prunus avium TaxID=42229 RepID=A0A6P5TFX3_PRUAV|nr:uncharacterized protein LOC110767113 [Prunus avium]